MFEITEKGNRFMEDSVASERPFYLQLWHYAVHGSNQSLPETLERWNARPLGRRHRDPTRAAMAEDFDRAVGITLAKIDQLGIRDRTYVIYMSDNGGPTRYLRGGKTNVTEGGLRVPLLVRGPGIAQSTYCDQPVVAYDLLPTVLDLAHSDAVPPPRVEGASWKPLLASGCVDGVDRPLEELVFFFAESRGRDAGPQAAIIAGRFKLLYAWPDARAVLFDLSEDIRESRDVTARYPDVAVRLERQLMDHLEAGIGNQVLARLASGQSGARLTDRDPRRARERRRSRRLQQRTGTP